MSVDDARAEDRPVSKRRGRAAVAATVLVALGAVALLAWRLGAAEPQARQRPPVTVAAARAEKAVWQTRVPAIGTLEAVNGIEVTAEVPGIVSAITFESGQRVERGQPLVQLDDAEEAAQLNRLQAELEQARSILDRDRRLRGEQFVPEEVFEESRTNVASLEAQIAEQEALLAKKAIAAPFGGELGIRRVDVGEYLSAGQAVVALQQIAPIHVNFSLPEQHYGQVEAGGPIELLVDAHPGRTFAGTITAVSPQVVAATRNFQVQATLANEERLLRPGMFAQVTVVLDDRRDVVTLPASAISYNPYGDAVYLVGPPDPPKAPDGLAAGEAGGGWWSATVERLSRLAAGLFGRQGGRGGGEAEAREAQPEPPPLVARRAFVTVGERRETKVEIVEGVEPGARVVTAGQIKLDDGARVVVSEQDVGEEAAQPPRPGS